MGVRKVFEAELDGPSVIVWEGGSGTRVVYHDEPSAERAAGWLINKANQFHAAKESNDGSQSESMVSIVCYGDQEMTEFAFVRDYLSRMRRAGFEIQNGLSRPSLEFW